MSSAPQAARQESLSGLHAREEAVPAHGPLRLAWDYFRQIFALASFFALAILINLLAGGLSWLGLAPKNPDFWRKVIARLFSVWMFLARLLWVVRVDFPERKQLYGLRGAIVAANHPCLVDAFALLLAVPRAVCIMRSDLRANPALSHLARLAGYIANDRGPALVREGIARLEKGENLLIFPEGTRTSRDVLNSFKRGFALMATRSGAGVQTVIIRFHGKYLSKASGLLTLGPLPVDLSVRLGRVFHPSPKESADHFAERLEAYFRSELTGQTSPGRDH